jgi:hypothetical protein
MDSIGEYENIYPERVYKLPRTPKEVDINNGISCIFDSAPLGQFLYGQDPRNIDICGNSDNSSFINTDADYSVENWKINWYEDGPYCEKTKIAMIHVHCKNLKKCLDCIPVFYSDEKPMKKNIKHKKYIFENL